MSLPEDYLRYPYRAYGMDHTRYDWRAATKRPPVAWSNGAALAVMAVVLIEHHTLEPVGQPFKHPGAMQTPYPDLRHYTTRDYGNRVGVFRIIEALKRSGMKATFAFNANQLDRLRPLVEVVLDEGHEIAAYGLSTDHIHWGGLDRQTEARWVAEVRQRFAAAGLSPRTWMSPARQESFATLDVIAAEGFDICLDWELDEAPATARTDAGSITLLPVSNELDDRTLMVDRRQSETEWSDQVLEAATYLASGAERFGGRMLGLTLTPYVSGQPFRIPELKRILSHLAEAHSWVATASELADAATPIATALNPRRVTPSL